MRNLLLIFLCLFSLDRLFAQENANNWHFTFNSGLVVEGENASTLAFDLTYKNGLAYNFGIGYERMLTDRFAVGTEFLFSGVRTKSSSRSNSLEQSNLVYADGTSLLNYLSLPIYASYKVGKFSVQLGIQPKLSILDVNNYTNVFIVDDEVVVDETNNEFQTTHDNLELGIISGIQYRLNSRWWVRADYQRELTNIELRDNANRYHDGINFGQLTVGLRYNIGRND